MRAPTVRPLEAIKYEQRWSEGEHGDPSRVPLVKVPVQPLR